MSAKANQHPLWIACHFRNWPCLPGTKFTSRFRTPKLSFILALNLSFSLVLRIVSRVWLVAITFHWGRCFIFEVWLFFRYFNWAIPSYLIGRHPTFLFSFQIILFHAHLLWFFVQVLSSICCIFLFWLLFLFEPFDFIFGETPPYFVILIFLSH